MPYSLELICLSFVVLPACEMRQPKFALGFDDHWRTRVVTSKSSQAGTSLPTVRSSTVATKSLPAAPAPPAVQLTPLWLWFHVAWLSTHGLSSAFAWYVSA